MNRFIWFSIFLMCASRLFAQTEMVDTLVYALHQKPRPLAGFGTRNSFVQNSRADILGVKAGISFIGRVRMGIGYNYLNSEIHQFSTDVKPVDMQLRLRYISFYFEYVYFKNKHWEFSIPLQLGIGKSRYMYSAGGNEYARNSGVVILYEPMVRTQYYILPWLGVEADVGLRLMLKNNRAISRNFNSPMYAIGMFIAWEELFKSVFPHASFTQRF